MGGVRDKNGVGGGGRRKGGGLYRYFGIYGEHGIQLKAGLDKIN